MVPVMFMAAALIAMLCATAYTLAVYALPFMLGLSAAQFWRQIFSIIGGGFVGVSAVTRLGVSLMPQQM